MPDPRQKLYNALSSKFDLGSYDEFNSKMNNPESRKKLYNSVSSNFDLGSYDEFESKIGGVKKKDGTKPNSTSTSVSTKQVSEQTNGSSGSQQYEYKPVYDERGREVKIKNEKGELVPYMEKVPKGFASSTEEREIIRQEQKQKASKPIVSSANLKKYQEATKVNEDEKSALKQEVDDEFDKKGFWNGISDGAKKGFNFLADTFTAIGTFGTETEASKNFKLETDSFAKEKKQAEQELIASKQPVTPEAISEKAKEIKLKKKIDGLVVDKNNKFLSNLSEEEIKSLNLERVKQYKTLSDKDKYIATQSEILKNNFERDTKDYTTAVAIIKKNKEKGIETNQSLIDFAIEKENSLNEIITQVKELEAEYISNKENIGSAEEEVDFLKRNYDTADKIKTLAELGLGNLWDIVSNKLPLMVSDLDQAIFEPLRPGSSEGILSDDERQQLIDNSIDWENAKELAKSKVKKDVDFENLSLSNFGQFFAQEIGTQISTFAQMAMPGGIISIGMTSAFDKYGKMEQESNNIAFEFNGKQFNGFEKENGEIVDSLGNTYDPKEVNITSIREADKSTANKFLTSVTFGTAEAVLGAMPTKNIFGRALSSFSTSGERTLFRQSVKEFVKAKGTSVLNDTATEVVSEGATQIIQNIADISSGNKNIGIYDGVDHAAVSAGMLSFFMSASPAVAGLALKPFSESKENKQVNENLQEIFALQSQLNNTEISDISKTTIQNRINELEKANSEVLDKIASRTKGISKETFDAIKDVNKKQELLIIQASEISKDNSLDKEVKKKIIADLESQFNNLETKRNKLASGKSTILDALSDNESTRLKENAANLLVNEEKAKGKTDEEINFTEEEINKKAIEIYNQNAVQQEATITETKQEAQPQAEIQKTEQEVLETPIVENETAPSQVDNVDGNIQPGIEPMAEVEQGNNENGNQNIQSPNDGRNVERKVEIKIADNGQSYTVEKTNLGIVITDKKGKKPSKVTERKILDEYSKTINFTQGARVDESFDTSAETYIDDIAEKSKNASEIAEAIAYVEVADMNEGKVDPIQIAIANAIGEKAVEKSSFTNVNDRNNITQSIALQYFAPKGKGKGLDQIAMEVEYEIYGDYNANNPRITEEDIANFMVDNPRGSVEFLNRNKNATLEKLRAAFTDVTGLPAKQQFIEAAIAQNNEAKNQTFIGNSLYILSDEDLLSLSNEYDQFKEFEATNLENDGQQQKEAINEAPQRVVNISNNQELGEEPRVQEARGGEVEEQQKEITPEEQTKIDAFKKWLEDTDKRLKDFGDENLGINIPIVVARGAIKAMKAAVATAQTVQEIIQAGLDFVKQSEWYQNLSKKEQNDVDANFQDYINKPFQGTETKKSRLKIEEEIQERLDNNESEQDIIDSISDRREKMIAQDYIERQKNLSVPEVRKKVAESFEKADEALKDKKTTTEKIDKAFRNFIARFFDRQFVPKFILNKAGGRLVRNYLIASKGATGYAKQMYDEAYAKIYKGLTSAEIKTLDKMIQLRRFIAIDKNRAENNMPDVVHPDFINRQDAEIELAELEKELGVEKFKDLNKRTDAYFDEFRGLLTEMQKSGLISKESLDMFFEIDYQPRMFLEFLQNNETDFVPETSSNASLSADQIKKLEEGLNTSLIYDSQYLLSRSMNIRAKSIAMNNTNKKLVEFMEKQAKVVDDLRNKKDKTQKEKDTIKYFDELSKRVKINPIIGFTDTGSPKYKYALPNGFKNAYYYIDGVKHNIMMEEALHEQYFDSAKGFLNGNTKEVVAMASGTAVVKALATGNNPTFFITNTPRDFFFIATFSEEYGMSVLVNMAKLAKDATLGIRDIKKGNGNFKNFVKYGGMMDFLKNQGKLKHTEIQKLFDKVDNKKREGVSSVLNFVTASKLQMYSEIGFRMAVFNRSVKNQLKELGYTKIEDVKDQSQVDDIYTNAVASARGIMDFNQGGKITKDADAFIPYLNAATQGTRVMFDNFRERPFETTFRTAQTAGVFSGAVIGLSIAAFSAFGDDDDEMTPTERYLYAKKGVSKYDQTNYFIIFTGQKTESGQYSYIRIAKPQQITPFFSMTDGIMTSFIKAKIGDESPTDAIDNVMFAFEKNISPLEFSVTGNIARNPFLKSALSYSTGYDFYRGEDLSYLRGKVPVPAEGFESKTVEDFYKKIGEESGMSPVRFKAAVESFITTPSTSPYVGFLYGGLDAMASDKDGKEVIGKLGKDLLKSTFNRVRKETTDFNRRLENDKALKKKIEQVEIENLKTKLLFKKYADAYTNKEMSVAEISKELEKVAQDNPFEAKRLKKMIKDKIKNKDISPYVFEIKYAKSAESKALMLIDLFGDDLKDMSKLDKEEKKLMFQLKKMGAINKEVMFEYKKLVE